MERERQLWNIIVTEKGECFHCCFISHFKTNYLYVEGGLSEPHSAFNQKKGDD